MKKALTCLVLQLLFIVHSFAGEKWTAKRPIPIKLFDLSAVCVGDVIYVIGGDDQTSSCSNRVFAYNINTDTWMEMSPMPRPHFYFDAVAVGNKIYAMGGGNSSVGTLSRKVDVYDIATDTWMPRADIPTPKTFYSATVVDGKIYLFGGDTTFDYTSSSVAMYDPATDTWVSGTPHTPALVSQHDAVAVGGRCYIVGVEEDYSTYVYASHTGIYDPVLGTWEEGPAMPATHMEGAATLLDGRIYYMAGYPSSSPDSINWYLDLATNTWGMALNCLRARSSCVAVAAPNHKIYLLGGTTCTSPIQRVDWNHEYDPNAPEDTETPETVAGAAQPCIYPNPCPRNKTLRVRLPQDNAQHEPKVINVSGQLMNVPYRQQANELLLDVSGLSCGVYVLGGTGLASITFIVE